MYIEGATNFSMDSVAHYGFKNFFITIAIEVAKKSLERAHPIGGKADSMKLSPCFITGSWH